MKKVYLGVGHGGSDSGAVGYIVEKDANLNMALACRDYLTANGVEVKISRTTDKDVSLTNKINECNRFNPDLALDIHNNAGGGDGFEVYHTINGGTGKILAQNIEAEIKAIGQNSRGLKTRKNSSGTDYFGFIRQTNCPSVITETVFVDNKQDAEQADTLEEQKQFGIAIAKGILRTLNIEPTKEPVKVENVVDKQEYSYKQFVGEVQKAIGAKVDNIAGPETLSKTVTISKTQNSTHAVVKPIQKYLYSLGYTEVGEADGIAGSKFDTAIKRFQKDNSCIIDGEITAKNKTWKKLLKIA